MREEKQHLFKVLFNGLGFIPEKVKAIEVARIQPDHVWEHCENKIPVSVSGLNFTVKRAKTQYTVTCIEEQEDAML